MFSTHTPNSPYKIALIFLAFGFFIVVESTAQKKPRVIVSSDIGGTDPDDFQSMIHYLMYADQFETEGLIASPYGPGRKKDILDIIALYEKDYHKLNAHGDFPSPASLREVTKQGETERAPLKGYRSSTEGSDWIISCARKESDSPLWVLVWGGLEDVAQALHDAPDIADKLRVYWIAGPNKKWGADVYDYVASNYPELWMIETNSTYRGWFVDDQSNKPTNVKSFYDSFINGKGAMGRDFVNYYDGVIKMGDTPSVAYLLNGDPEDPEGRSWGGSFVPLTYSSKRIFYQHSSTSDTIPVFSLIEWVFDGPDDPTKDIEKSCFTLHISGQEFEGYYAGEGKYIVRFVPKSTGEWSYSISSKIEELDGKSGGFVAVDPWPGDPSADDYRGLNYWWSDHPGDSLFEGAHQGAKSIFRFQEDFLMDWARRWEWLAD